MNEGTKIFIGVMSFILIGSLITIALINALQPEIIGIGSQEFDTFETKDGHHIKYYVMVDMVMSEDDDREEVARNLYYENGAWMAEVIALGYTLEEITSNQHFYTMRLESNAHIGMKVEGWDNNITIRDVSFYFVEVLD